MYSPSDTFLEVDGGNVHSSVFQDEEMLLLRHSPSCSELLFAQLIDITHTEEDSFLDLPFQIQIILKGITNISRTSHLLHLNRFGFWANILAKWIFFPY